MPNLYMYVRLKFGGKWVLFKSIFGTGWVCQYGDVSHVILQYGYNI